MFDCCQQHSDFFSECPVVINRLGLLKLKRIKDYFILHLPDYNQRLMQKILCKVMNN